MKKVLYILVFSLVTIAAKANLLSELRLSLTGNQFFTLTLDGQYFSYPDNKYVVNSIAPGTHYLQVFKANGFYGTAIAFSGYIQIPAASVVNAKIDRYGRFVVKSINPKYSAPVVYQPVPVSYPAYAPVFYPMSDYDFGFLRESIGSKNFESSRLQVAKQALSTQYLTTFQLIELMNLMSFESSKLELAKFAYSRITDKQRFYLVNDAFNFSSSITELDHYIRFNS